MRRRGYSSVMTTTRVFRNGSLTPAQYTGEALEDAEKADALRPEGHAPRHGSLFASPSLAGVGRWTDANHSCFGSRVDFDLTTREITVDPEGLFVYSVKAWEDHSWGDKEASVYWDSAIPLKDWDRIAAERNLDPSEWEVLLPVEAVLTTKNVSNKRLITAQPEGSLTRHNLMWALERRKAVRSIMW